MGYLLLVVVVELAEEFEEVASRGLVDGFGVLQDLEEVVQELGALCLGAAVGMGLL